VLYSNSLLNGFVWDDHFIIVQNTAIKDARNVVGFFTQDFWRNSTLGIYSGFYRPIVLVSFFLDFMLWGLNPFGFHLVNISIHLMNTLLVFFIITLLTKDRSLGLFSGIFFGIHPVQTEVVNAIFNRGDLLATFFVFLSLFLYLRFLSIRKSYLYVLSLCVFVFALLSKEIAFVLIILLLATDFYFIADLRWKSVFTRLRFYLGACGIY
jgi:predicted membrane-bound mannosyltransferase